MLGDVVGEKDVQDTSLGLLPPQPRPRCGEKWAEKSVEYKQQKLPWLISQREVRS